MARPPAPPSPPAWAGRLGRALSLTLSLPERTARALAALAGGGALLLTRTLLPGAVKNSTSYRFTLGMFQTFLVRNVAGMAAVEGEAELKDRFTQRKLLGSSFEAAGLLTMHLSPVWVFAVASDAARGGQVFLRRLVFHLKEHRVIAPDRDPRTLEQILEAVHDMGREGAGAVDMPPMSREELGEVAAELRRSAAALAENSAKLLPRFESLWDQIGRAAEREDLSVARVLGLLSVSAASLAGAGAGTVRAVGEAGYGILDEMVIDDYKASLDRIAEQGAAAYVGGHMRPFVENARAHFDFGRESWTQRRLKGPIDRLLARLAGKRRGPRD